SYFHNSSYNARQLLHLPQQTSISDGFGHYVASKQYAYDEFALGPSGQAGLDTTYTNANRGNVTTVTNFLDPQHSAGPVSVKMYYFDNGAVQKTQNPNDLAAGGFTLQTTGFNFGACASNPVIATTTTNALGQATTVTTDCFTGVNLSSVGLNGERS